MKISHRFPQKCILKKNDAFREIINNGKIWRGKWFKVFYQKSDNAAVGFSVPRKFGTAVKRNRAKRFMRESYRKHRLELSALRIVVIPKEKWDSLRCQDVEKEFVDFIGQVYR